MKKIIALILAILMLVSIVACSAKDKAPAEEEGTKAEVSKEATPATEETSEPKKLEKVRVAVMPSTMCAPIHYAVKSGYDKDFGMEIEMITFPTGSPMNEALAAKEWDIAGIGMAAVFGIANYGATWIAETVDSTPGMQIFIRPDSKIAQDKGYNPTYPELYGAPESVKGIDILVPTGTSAHICVMKWLEKIGLRAEDVNVIHMEYGQAFEAFRAGEGDALATYAPYLALCNEEGWIQAACLKGLGVDILDGLEVEDGYLEAHPEVVQAFTDMIYKVMAEFSADPELAINEALDWYTLNGRDVTYDSVKSDLQISPFINPEILVSDDYEFGAGMIGVAEFFANLGQIEPEKVAVVQEHINGEFYLNSYNKANG